MDETGGLQKGNESEAPTPGGASRNVHLGAPALASVTLSNFRSYARGTLTLDPAPVALVGANGTGKTNLLEAISLFAPGRGLRGAKLASCQRKAPHDRAVGEDGLAGALWAVSATLERPDGSWTLGTGLGTGAVGAERRLMRLNGADATGADLAELLPMLWLTPTMDRLFLEGASGRRRFLDRLVYGLDRAHARRTARYESAMRERARLLEAGHSDASWLAGLEAEMAEMGVAISEARQITIDALNAELAARDAAGSFPCAQLALEHAAGAAFDDAEDLARRFAQTRTRDASAGRTLTGPHLADLGVRHTTKRADARFCSTGEQKALLVSIVLANAWLQRRNSGMAPLLLLDEIAAHLDAGRRAALLAEIDALCAQAWMTGTDKSLFAAAEGLQIFTVAGGTFARVQ